MRIALVMVLGCVAAGAQDAPVLVSGPKPQVVAAKPRYATTSYLSRAGIMCGLGGTSSPVAAKPTAGCGVGFAWPPEILYVELGVMGPQANRSALTGYVSVDGNIPLNRRNAVYLPQVIVGYSRLFETGHAFDYGLALSLPRFGKARKENRYLDSMRIELRDYWTFANPQQHNVMLRVGLMGPDEE